MSGVRLLPSFVLAVLLAPACGSSATDAPHVAISPSLSAPKSLLDKVTSLTLSVIEGNVMCDDTIGQTTLPGGTDAATTIAKSTLGTSCPAGVKFCGDLSIAQSDTPRVFSALATDANNTTIAIGCASVVVNQDALPVPIKMFRFLAPPVCGDGIIEPTEQCEPDASNPASATICDANCQTNELLLSVGSTLTGTKTGGPGDKEQPNLVWPQQTGIDGRFYAFYTDHDASTDEVALRAMDADLSPIPASQAPALSAGSIYLPNTPGTTGAPQPAPFAQAAPAAAFLNGKYYVAFEDDNTPGTQGIDIHLRSMDDTPVADQTNALGINGGPAGPVGTAGAGAGEPLVQGKPAIAAGPMGRLYIAWEDAQSGGINGRNFTPPATLGTQNAVSTGTNNSGVSVAATTTGWVAVWLSGSTVKLRAVNSDGTPAGAEQAVNSTGTVAERPRVASLPDGRFAVVWNAGGDIFMQRYDATGLAIAGDQASSINNVVTDGDQTTPSIGASSAVGGSYVAVWLDVNTQNINGRMIGGSSGFLFNNVNGQSSEFQASRSAGRTRKNPVVVAGGSIPAVGVAWEDQSPQGAGIVARRLPVPSE